VSPTAWRFASIELNEPSKQVVRAYTPGEPIRRQAFAVLWDREDGRTYEALVDLTDDTVVSFEHVPGVQPNFTVDEWHDCDEVLRSDPQVIEALARRGITDPDLVLIDVWAYRDFLVPEKYGAEARQPYCDHPAPCTRTPNFTPDGPQRPDAMWVGPPSPAQPDSLGFGDRRARGRRP
jgi:primary-amine oxidase